MVIVPQSYSVQVVLWAQSEEFFDGITPREVSPIETEAKSIVSFSNGNGNRLFAYQWHKFTNFPD
jgi:hypothetical protein